MFEVSKGIPVPEKKSKIHSPRTLFLMSLDIDDSFECSRKEYQILKGYEKRAGIKLQSQRVAYGDWSFKCNNYDGDIVRVWRIA